MLTTLRESNAENKLAPVVIFVLGGPGDYAFLESLEKEHMYDAYGKRSRIMSTETMLLFAPKPWFYYYLCI